MSKFIDITGHRFQRLIAVSHERTLYANRMQVLWTLQCDCGAVIRTTGTHLRKGRVKSCGCLNNEATAARSRTHGKRRTPTYNVWATMRARCDNPKSIGFLNYGGRGIRVCGRWHDFANFLADMGERPGKGYSIDRKDNNGDYCPENCQWATRIEQGRNRRSNVLLTFNGKTMTVADWSRETGIRQQVIRRRLNLGWSHEDTLSRPVGKT